MLKFPKECVGCWGTKKAMYGKHDAKCKVPTEYTINTSPTRSYNFKCPCLECILKPKCSSYCNSRTAYYNCHPYRSIMNRRHLDKHE